MLFGVAAGAGGDSHLAVKTVDNDRPRQMHPHQALTISTSQAYINGSEVTTKMGEEARAYLYQRGPRLINILSIFKIELANEERSIFHKSMAGKFVDTIMNRCLSGEVNLNHDAFQNQYRFYCDGVQVVFPDGFGRQSGY